MSHGSTLIAAPEIRALLGELRCTPSDLAAPSLTHGQWSRVVDLARRHRVSGLLHRGLERAGRLAALSAADRAALLSDARQAAARSLMFRDSLRTVNRALTAAGVPFRLLKGAHVAHAIYESPELRDMIDIDILVPRHAVGTAAEALGRVGYQARASFAFDTQLDHHHHLTPLIRRSAPLEVHWQLIPRLGTTGAGAGLFDTGTPVSVDGETMYGLPIDDLLVHLCVHAARHHCFELGIRALVDVDQVVARHPDLDWRRVTARAVEWSAWRSTVLMLLVAHDLLGTPLPAEMLRTWEGYCDTGLRRLASRRALSATPLAPATVARFAAAPAAWSTLRHGAAQLLSRVEIARIYGLSKQSRLVPMLYPLRLLDVLRRHGAKAVWWILGESGEKQNAREQLVLSEWLDGAAPHGVSAEHERRVM